MKIEFLNAQQLLDRFPNRYRGADEKLTVDSAFVAFTAHDQTLYFEQKELPNAPVEKMFWVISKNVDFTEGRGPMVFHAAYQNFDDAVEYIMEQDGIYGSRQGADNFPGISVKGNAYVVSGFNGYDLKPFILR